MTTEKKYWFRANKFGLGWGTPSCWQGWVVLVGYIAALEVARRIFPSIPQKEPALFLVGIAVSLVPLIAIFWYKGDPQGRRWPQ